VIKYRDFELDFVVFVRFQRFEQKMGNNSLNKNSLSSIFGAAKNLTFLSILFSLFFLAFL